MPTPRPGRTAAVPHEGRDVAPAWQPTPAGDVLRFAAVPARLRTLALTVAVAVLAGGAVLTAAAVLLAGRDSAAGRLVVVAGALLLCLPLVAAVTLPFRWRTVPCTATAGEDALAVAIGDRTLRVAWDEVDDLVWRTGTEYARVVLRAGATRVSLLVGVARPLPGRAAALAPLGPGAVRALAAAGTAAGTRRPGHVRYRRVRPRAA
ncbi:hypothetical protein [Cellulomonas iranensis]|uniref:hypothetical protein n=1 Tax=Cellulomonas iranensis TaxID=76862 RepID=UPI000B3D3FCB|nr:hypothetical protein [Cellulomonas iranensis]